MTGYARLRTAALATALVFALSGVLLASWVSRLPTIRDQLAAGSAALGLALLGPGVGSLLAMPSTGRLSRRFGSRAVVAATAFPACVAIVALSLAPTVLALGITLLVWGALNGSWDVAMNIQGSAVERRAGRAWMPRYHASWSVGGIVGAGLGALAARAGLSVTAHLLVVALVTAVLLVAALRLFIDERDDEAQRDDARPAHGPLFTRRLVLVGVVTLCATTIEGAAADWLALYLTDGRGVAASGAALGYTVFAVAMAASRFLGTPLIERLGRVSAVRLAGVVAGGGVVLTVTAPALLGAYLGAVAWGFGVALVFPAAMSAGGEVPGRAADAIAAVATIGYGGFLLGPPLIGVLGQHVGLGSALLVLPVLAVGIVVLSPALRPYRQPGTAGPAGS